MGSSYLSLAIDSLEGHFGVPRTKVEQEHHSLWHSFTPPEVCLLTTDEDSFFHERSEPFPLPLRLKENL